MLDYFILLSFPELAEDPFAVKQHEFMQQAGLWLLYCQHDLHYFINIKEMSMDKIYWA